MIETKNLEYAIEIITGGFLISVGVFFLSEYKKFNRAIENKSKKSLENLTFEEKFHQFTIISIHDTLTTQNNLDEVPFALGEEGQKDNYPDKICLNFEKRYNQKLKYRIDRGLCYFSLNKS